MLEILNPIFLNMLMPILTKENYQFLLAFVALLDRKVKWRGDVFCNCPSENFICSEFYENVFVFIVLKILSKLRNYFSKLPHIIQLILYWLINMWVASFIKWEVCFLLMCVFFFSSWRASWGIISLGIELHNSPRGKTFFLLKI